MNTSVFMEQRNHPHKNDLVAQSNYFVFTIKINHRKNSRTPRAWQPLGVKGGEGQAVARSGHVPSGPAERLLGACDISQWTKLLVGKEN